MKVFYFLPFLLMLACSDTKEKVNTKTFTKPTTLNTKLAPIIQDTIMQTPTPATESFSTDYIMGKFDPQKNPSFIEIKVEHASRKGMFLRKETYTAFQKMYAAALQDGIRLVIRSATRPFFYQKQIWEAKWNGARLVEGQNLSKTIADKQTRALKILEFSSMPGTSRHHWGTDFDINAFENSYFEKGEGKKIYDWMLANAAQYGFCQPYTPKGTERPNGYNEEKWHWSYSPLAKPLTQQAKIKLNDDMIQGFDGAETAKAIKVVKKYVLGINKACW